MNYAAYATGAVPGSVGVVAEAPKMDYAAYASGAIPQTVQPQPYGTAVPQMAPTGAAIQPVYGEQRPTFSADGSGMPYTSMMTVSAASAHPEISYDTNSKDPVMVRSRVFIGRLTTAPVTRDDLITLFKPFGTVLALNHFKQGYGFVQFSQPSEADAAVNGLNGKKWMGVIIELTKKVMKAHLATALPNLLYIRCRLSSVVGKDMNIQIFLDVHHVDLAVQAKKRAELESTRKRGAEDDELLAAKLSRTSELASLDDIKQQNRLNRAAALGDPTTNVELFDSEMADTLICGSCRYVTADYENFKNHRIAGCHKKKEEDEPAFFKCASCDSRFKSAWAILCHLTEFHRMMLYKVEEEQEQQKDNRNKHEQNKKVNAEEHSPEPSSIKKPDSTAGTPKPTSESFSQQTQLPQAVSSQQQQEQQQQQQDARTVSYASYASSQPAYATSSSSQPVYAQSAPRSVYAQPPQPQPTYSQTASYSQIPGLGSSFTMPPAPEPPQDSIISSAPVRYSNGSSSGSH